MGKASKFFRSLLGFKTPETTATPPSRSDNPNKQPKRRWSFVKSHRDKSHHNGITSDSFPASLSGARDTPIHHRHHSSDASKNSIAVAAAKAAVAEAAVATAQAAAEVVRMTGRTAGSSGGYGLREERAAVKIQSVFRAYLAKRALKALKGLVKLQALVRGHILRKRTTNMMRRLQMLIRAQARARAGRLIADSPKSTSKGSSYFHHNGPPTPEKFDYGARSMITKYDNPSILKKSGSKSYTRANAKTFLDNPIDDEKNDKILEIDPGKPRRRSLFQQDQISHSYSQSLTSKGSTVQQPNRSPSEEEVSFCSPAKVNGSMRLGPFTPAKSDSSRSCVSGYTGHPNYMAYTESSRAKVRSLSAPRQRPQLEGSSAVKRYSVYGYGSGVQPISMSFASKAYPGSGRLDRLGMPVGGCGSGESEFSGYYWN